MLPGRRTDVQVNNRSLLRCRLSQNKLQGKFIHSHAREFVANVYKLMNMKAGPGVPKNLKKTKERVTEATGVSETYVRGTAKEVKTTAFCASNSFTNLDKENRVSSPKSTPGNCESVIRWNVDDIVACRPVARQRPRNKHLYKSRC
jgi:hypothetical protein